jgi:predicted adenylyl cyclase CyaB
VIEIERKFRLTEEQGVALDERLQSQYGPLEPVHQVDEVFLLGIDSFKDFEPGMPVTRLRTVNGETQLAFKRRVNDAGDAVEHELGVTSADTMRQILLEMDYRPVTIVDKVRLEAKVGKLAIMHDQVKGLGHFCEIEIVAEDESYIPDAEAQIMTTAKEFGYTEADLESRKYDQLIALQKGG